MHRLRCPGFERDITTTASAPARTRWGHLQEGRIGTTDASRIKKPTSDGAVCAVINARPTATRSACPRPPSVECPIQTRLHPSIATRWRCDAVTRAKRQCRARLRLHALEAIPGLSQSASCERGALGPSHASSHLRYVKRFLRTGQATTPAVHRGASPVR